MRSRGDPDPARESLRRHHPRQSSRHVTSSSVTARRERRRDPGAHRVVDTSRSALRPQSRCAPVHGSTDVAARISPQCNLDRGPRPTPVVSVIFERVMDRHPPMCGVGTVYGLIGAPAYSWSFEGRKPAKMTTRRRVKPSRSYNAIAEVLVSATCRNGVAPCADVSATR